MDERERYSITNELAKTRLDDNMGELWTYPAVHIYHGVMSDKIVKDVIEYLDKTRNDEMNKRLVANIDGTQSDLDPNDPLMVEFIDHIMHCACIFVDQCEMELDRRWIGGEPQEDYSVPKIIKIDDLWDVKMMPGDYNPIHIHNTAASRGLASICYLKVPEGLSEFGTQKSDSFNQDGYLKLLWGLPHHQTSDAFTCPTSVLIRPEVGHFYIFPKNLHHMVYPYKVDEDRWSLQVNFNCWPENEPIGLSSREMTAAGRKDVPDGWYYCTIENKLKRKEVRKEEGLPIKLGQEEGKT